MRKKVGSRLGLSRATIIAPVESRIYTNDRALPTTGLEDFFMPEALPEEKLVQAFLLRAYNDAITRRSSGIFSRETEAPTKGARRWFKNESMEPFSFLWVVEVLDLSTTFVEKLRDFISKVENNEINPESLPTFKSFQAKFGD